ncbi:MAG: hydantoinase B/oxoprolinase family protein [Acidimicrobiales bacterium]
MGADVVPPGGAGPGRGPTARRPPPSSGVRNMPVEINEAITPVVFWRKEPPGSGGAGRFRGGHGQVVELGLLEDEPFTLACTYERVRHPARGREGGEPGACGSIRLAGSGEELVAVGRNVVPAGERVVLSFPGGGGYGDPAERDPAAVEDERRSGLL